MGWHGYEQPPDWHATVARIVKRDRVCRIRFTGCTVIATTADHRQPVAEGGGHGDDNLQGACASCHAIKSEAERRRGVARRARTRTRTRSHPSNPNG
jgi:5-methylcytosine-specific restriction protein A